VSPAAAGRHVPVVGAGAWASPRVKRNDPSVRGARLGPSFQRMPVAARHPAVKRPQQGAGGLSWDRPFQPPAKQKRPTASQITATRLIAPN
jgi:hypothetical protein